MKRIDLGSLAAWAALAVAAAGGVAAVAQTAPPANSGSMTVPPSAGSAAAGTDHPNNPDNMPIKRPAQPTNDRISRTPPASAAQAK